MKIELQINQIINTYAPAISNGDETIDSILIRYPQIAAELRPRLEAAIWLYQVKQNMAPRSSYISSSRKYLETQVESMQPHTIWQRLLRIHTPKRWLVNLGILTLLVITLAAMINDLILTAHLSIPGEPLYSTKLVIEKCQLALTLNQTAKTDLHIQFSRERTTEFMELVLQGDYEYLPDAARRLESEITGTLYSLGDTPTHADDMDQSILANANETLTNELFILNMLKWTSPPSASPSIELAIQATQSGIFALH